MARPNQIASPGVYVTDDIGLEVTDGTASRVQLGLLPNGSYGLQVNGPNLSGAISGSPPSIVTGTPGAQFTDKGIEVSDGTQVRATLGNIGGPYGLKVVSSDGATVIIDGASNMFKIAATGTVSTTIGAGGSAETTVVLTALGTLSATPAHSSYGAPTNGVSDYWHHANINARNFKFVSATSGGAVDQSTLTLDTFMRARTSLNGSSQVVFGWGGDNSLASAVTWYCRYYILKEVAF